MHLLLLLSLFVSLLPLPCEADTELHAKRSTQITKQPFVDNPAKLYTMCNNGKKDGTETDIDLGGLCSLHFGYGAGLNDACSVSRDCAFLQTHVDNRNTILSYGLVCDPGTNLCKHQLGEYCDGGGCSPIVAGGCCANSSYCAGVANITGFPTHCIEQVVEPLCSLATTERECYDNDCWWCSGTGTCNSTDLGGCTNMASCPYGYFLNVSDTTMCVKCPVNETSYYKSDGSAATTCKSCRKTEFLAPTTQGPCLRCPPGFLPNAAGNGCDDWCFTKIDVNYTWEIDEWQGGHDIAAEYDAFDGYVVCTKCVKSQAGTNLFSQEELQSFWPVPKMTGCCSVLTTSATCTGGYGELVDGTLERCEWLGASNRDQRQCIKARDYYEIDGNEMCSQENNSISSCLTFESAGIGKGGDCHYCPSTNKCFHPDLQTTPYVSGCSDAGYMTIPKIEPYNRLNVVSPTDRVTRVGRFTLMRISVPTGKRFRIGPISFNSQDYIDLSDGVDTAGGNLLILLNFIATILGNSALVNSVDHFIHSLKCEFDGVLTEVRGHQSAAYVALHYNITVDGDQWLKCEWMVLQLELRNSDGAAVEVDGEWALAKVVLDSYHSNDPIVTDVFGNPYSPWDTQRNLVRYYRFSVGMCANSSSGPGPGTVGNPSMATLNCADYGVTSILDVSEGGSLGGCYWMPWKANGSKCVEGITVRETAAPTTSPTKPPSPSPTRYPTTSPTLHPSVMPIALPDDTCVPKELRCSTDDTRAVLQCDEATMKFQLAGRCPGNAECDTEKNACELTVPNNIKDVQEWVDGLGLFVLVQSTRVGEKLRIWVLPKRGTLYHRLPPFRKRAAVGDAVAVNDTLTADTANDTDAFAFFYKPDPNSNQNDQDYVVFALDEDGDGTFGAPLLREIDRTNAPDGTFSLGNGQGGNGGEISTEAIVGGIVGGVLILFIAIIVLVVVMRRRDAAAAADAKAVDGALSVTKNRKGARARNLSGIYDNNALDDVELAENDGSVYSTPPLTRSDTSASIASMRMSSIDDVTANALKAIDAKFRIKPSQLKKGKKIGEGAFGYVYKGEFRHQTVAIKEMQKVNDKAMAEMLAEAVGMQNLRPHENIVTLYGVIVELPTFGIVTEFCARGSLDELLYGAKTQFPFTDQQIMSLVIGAAKGCSHLHYEGIIHRDLAARNVLVSEHFVAKIADFGLAREVDGGGEEDENVQQKTTTEVGPIKWMAPEQMSEQKYSKMSDVWSFAVVMFECLAREPPWKGQKNLIVAGKVMGGSHLTPPSTCPPALANIMLDAWAMDPTARPTMDQIVSRLQSPGAWGSMDPLGAASASGGGGGGGGSGDSFGGAGGAANDFYSMPSQRPSLPPSEASVSVSSNSLGTDLSNYDQPSKAPADVTKMDMPDHYDAPKIPKK